MSKKFQILTLVLLALLQGCATHLPGEKAAIVSSPSHKQADMAPPLEVSVDELSGLSSQEYRGFLVSFQNNTSEWIRVEQANIEFLKNKDLQFLLGEDLAIYIKSVNRRNRIQNHNRSLALAALTIAAGAAAGSQDSTVSQAGFLALSGTIGYETIRQTLKRKDAAEFVKALPEGHILKPISIPPGLSNSSWFIVKMPEKQKYKAINISVTENNGHQSEFAVASKNYIRKLDTEFRLQARKKGERFNANEFETFKNKRILNLFKKVSH